MARTSTTSWPRWTSATQSWSVARWGEHDLVDSDYWQCEHATVCAEICRRHGVRIATIAHAGDGNLHPLLITPSGDDLRRAAQSAFDELLDAAISLGGTVTGEHGVGLLKRDGMRRELGPQVCAILDAVKQTLDPLNLFNPGKALLPP